MLILNDLRRFKMLSWTILSPLRLPVPPSCIVVQPFASNLTPNPDGASDAVQQLACSDRPHARLKIENCGEMAEWLKAAVC
jgi:hypothetical protein